ncbi:MAG: glycosyltransferase family 1 protein [Microgenomates group bacterium]
MNIAIDTTPLSSGHAMRGVGVYTKNLIDALQQYESKHSYSFFTRGEKIPDTAEIVHYPYFDPFFLTLPWEKTIPTVVTVHDLIPLVFPEQFPAGIRGRVKWNMQKIALRRVEGIITVSKCSKKDVERIVRIPESKIHAVYSAATPGYEVKQSKQLEQVIKEKYQLPANFMLFVGDVNWNKNVLGLLSAFALVLQKKKNTHLVLVGGAFKNSQLQETQKIEQCIHDLHLEDHVTMTGFVSQEELVGLYSMATCLVEPSFYEGFGLPVLEAMVCGCPVVVADNSSLSEIAGPSLRMDAGNVQGMAETIIRMFTLSPTAKKKMHMDSIAWAKTFSWEKTAHETVAVYETILAKK